MEKWSAKFKEMLIEAPSTKKGALFYHLTFVLRRVAIVINVIMLGALGPNFHISVLCIIQFVTLLMTICYPMFESMFQKASNIFAEAFLLLMNILLYNRK